MNFLTRYWPSLLVVAVIVYATLFPDPLPDDPAFAIPHLDKLIHAIMFGGMAGALAFDYRRSHPAPPRLGHRTMAACCLIAAAFGLVIELAQEAMGLGRSGDEWDFIADCTGTIVAYFTAPPAIAAVLRHRK